MIGWMQGSGFCIYIPVRSLAINSWLLVETFCNQVAMPMIFASNWWWRFAECWLLTAKVCSRLPGATWVAAAAAAGGAGMPVLILSYLLFLASLLWRQAGLCPPPPPPPGNFAIFLWQLSHFFLFLTDFPEQRQQNTRARVQGDDWSRYRTTSCHIFLGYKTHFIKTFGETWYENHIKIFET